MRPERGREANDSANTFRYTVAVVVDAFQPGGVVFGLGGGVKIWYLVFGADPSRARAGINPFTRHPMTFVRWKLKR
jgi:hypothetical protein